MYLLVCQSGASNRHRKRCQLVTGSLQVKMTCRGAATLALSPCSFLNRWHDTPSLPTAYREGDRGKRRAPKTFPFLKKNILEVILVSIDSGFNRQLMLLLLVFVQASLCNSPVLSFFFFLCFYSSLTSLTLYIQTRQAAFFGLINIFCSIFFPQKCFILGILYCKSKVIASYGKVKPYHYITLLLLYIEQQENSSISLLLVSPQLPVLNCNPDIFSKDCIDLVQGHEKAVIGQCLWFPEVRTWVETRARTFLDLMGCLLGIADRYGDK